MSKSLLDKLDLPLPVKELLNYLSKSDFEIYLIGGFIRDLLLKVNSLDLDFVVIDRNPVDLCSELAKMFDGNSFLLDKETLTTRLILHGEKTKGYTFDFTLVKKDKLEEDFLRRDFTINALAVSLKNPDLLIDKFNGLNDLKNKKIKAIKPKNLLEDPLRILRAFRFAAQLLGEIESETFSFISKNINYFNESVSPERISVEVWKILDLKSSFKYVKQMADVGLLEKIIPELAPCRKVTPNSHHHLWLFDHSVELLKTFEENLQRIPKWAQEELQKPFGELTSPKKIAVAKLASLLHDIGKPGTWEIKQVNGKEKHTFYGHDKSGAEMIEHFGERLKLSNSITDFLAKLVHYHLRPYQLSQGDVPISSKALYRFFRDVSEDTPALLILALADLHATLGPEITEESILKSENLILLLFNEYEKYLEEQKEKAKKPKLLDGNEIMELTGLCPSRSLGDLIKELDEAIGIGEIKTKEEAVSWVKQRVK